MENLSEIKVIGFDWDGTLVDSIKIKSQSFVDSLVSFYPELDTKHDEIKSLYISSRGLPRFEQIKQVQIKYGLKPLSREEIKKWSDLFTSSYLKEHLLLFNDTISTLNELKKRGYKLFLGSSVPQQDLERTLKNYPLDNYFELILGTRNNGKFKKGIVHLTYVSQTLETPLEKIAFVGDAAEDVRGANEAGCFSIGKYDHRNTESLEEIQKSNPKLIIENLSQLLTHFQKVAAK